MLDWSIVKLAEESGLSISTIKRMERSTPQPISAEAFDTVRGALEGAGVRFFTEGGFRVGVWLYRSPR